MQVQRVIMPGTGVESWTVVETVDWSVVDPVDRFLAHLTTVERSPQTVRSYAFDLRDFFTFLISRRQAWQNVTLEDFGRFVAWLRLPVAARTGAVTALPSAGEQCSSSTINRKLSAVTAFYEFHLRHGVDCGRLLSTLKPRAGRTGSWRPFLAHLAGLQRHRTIKLKVPQRLSRDLPPTQVILILGACEHLRDRLLIGMLAGTGMRIGEALGLRHEDIEAASRLVRIRARPNANGARAKSGARDIPVAAELIRLYADYMAFEYEHLDCDYVFVNLWRGERGLPWQYWNVTDVVDRLRKRSGVEFTPHMLRHTYATDLLRRGLPAEVVQKLLGHASITTTMNLYAHLQVEDVRRSLETVGWLPTLNEALTR